MNITVRLAGEKYIKTLVVIKSGTLKSVSITVFSSAINKATPLKSINVPTIGIGASNNCDGQILVFDDLIGLNPIKFRFVKKYINIKKEISKAVSKYVTEVKTRKFPSKKYSFN